MPRVRPLEIKALRPLVEQDWPDEEDPKTGRVKLGQERLIEALIVKLDEVRQERTSYMSVVQVGKDKPIYVGVGPFAGSTSAANALAKQRQTYGNLISGAAVVPVETPESFEARLKDLDS